MRREEGMRIARKVAERIDPVVERVSFNGSIRRMCEDCGDVDILAEPKVHALVKSRLEGSRGRQVLSVEVEGVAVNLTLTERGHWGSQMAHTTGPFEHNVAVRLHAKELGLKANQYGVFRDGFKLPGSSETEGGFYRALGLRWIPPEFRLKG